MTNMSVTFKIYRIGLLCILLKICTVDSTIDIFDHFGRKVDSFQDREAIFDDDELIAMEGYILTSDPPDACSPIAPPPFLSNFTVGRFVLINGTESQCGLTKKVINAKVAGYDLAVIFDPFPMPFEYLHVEASYPNYEQNIQVVFISYMDGISIRDNYLYNNSYEYNFKVRIKPNTPDITYYMYLFGAVIGVCFFVMLLFMMCLLIKCIQERRRRRRNRLSSRQIKQIPTTKFSKGDQYDVCAICLEDYNEGDKLRLLPCSHAYHAKCIDPWLMNNRRNCPLCKRKITFGDSGDESDSDDSELTSPAENTPLLTSPTHRAQSWGTFAINPVQTSSNSDGSGPSSLPSEPMMRINRSFVPDSNTLPKFSPLPSGQILSDDESESLLPPPQLSVNRQNAATSENAAPVEVNFVLGDSEVTNDANGHRGLIV